MKIWIKNKFTIVSLILYVMLTLMFGNLSGYRLPVFILSLISLPFIYNLKIDSKSIGTLLLAGFIFGLYITPFDISSSNPSIFNKISYFVLIISLNLFYHLHRGSYMKRKELLNRNISEKRDMKIDEVLNPIRKKFFQ